MKEKSFMFFKPSQKKKFYLTVGPNSFLNMSIFIQ